MHFRKWGRMDGTFKYWLDTNGKKIAWLSGILCTVQAVIAAMLALAGYFQKATHALPIVSNGIQAGFLLIAIMYSIGYGYKTETNSFREAALSKLYRCWYCSLICWACFYVLKTLNDLHAPLPFCLVAGWFPNAISRCPSALLFIMYVIACDRWKFPSSNIAIASVIGVCVVFTIFDAGIQQQTEQVKASIGDAPRPSAIVLSNPSPQEATLSNLYKQKDNLTCDATRMQIVSSAWDFLILAMFVSRLDSKIFALSPLVVYTLYLYAALQLVFSIADDGMVKSLTAVAFIGKAVLIVTVAWLFETPGMSLFLRRIREIGTAATTELQAANANPTQRPWSYKGAGD
jgi:hypothetical protein